MLAKRFIIFTATNINFWCLCSWNLKSVPILQPTQLVSFLCAQCVVCISSIFATSCKVCFFFFHVGQRFHNNMSFSLEFFMESDFKEDDARQSTRLFCMHEKCFKSKGQTLPNLFVQNFYSSSSVSPVWQQFFLSVLKFCFFTHRPLLSSKCAHYNI